MVVLLDELDEVVVEAVVALVPQLLEAPHPVVDRPQRGAVHPVQPGAADAACTHEVHLAQHLQVLGDERLGEHETIDEVTDRSLAGTEDVEDVAASLLGDGVEHVGGGRSSWHVADHIPIWEYVKNDQQPTCDDRNSLWKDPPVRYGLSIPNFAEPARLVEVATTAEQNGWDGFFVWDHVLVDRNDPPPIREPWTVLAAAAMVTSRVRLGTLVTPVARRRPWVLARQVTTVDHLSNGRAVLGVGLGVPPDAEYLAFGESGEPRAHAALLDEGLSVIDALWSGEPVEHSGHAHHLHGVRFRPTPVQRPRVPIWVAAALPARAGVRRAARWDGVAPLFSQGDELRPVSPDEVKSIVEDIRELRGDLDAFDVVVWEVALEASLRAAYVEAGATWLIEGPAPGADWLDDAMLMATEGPPSP